MPLNQGFQALLQHLLSWRAQRWGRPGRSRHTHDLGHGGKQLGKFRQSFRRHRQNRSITRRTDRRVQMDPVRGNLSDQAGNAFHLAKGVVQARHRKHLDPVFTPEFGAERLEPLNECLEPELRMGVVGLFEGGLVPGAQGGFHHIGLHRRGPDLGQKKKRTITQENTPELAPGAEGVNHLAKPGMERGLPAPGQGHAVGLPVMGQPVVELSQHLGDRDILATGERLIGGHPDLAVGAVVGADLGRDEINTKRTAQPPGADWAEQVSILTLHQAGEMASTGHSPAHRPQSTHLSASITYCLSPSAMASCGQTGAQLPHFVHLSEIIYDMSYSFCVLKTDNTLQNRPPSCQSSVASHFRMW